MALNWKFLSTPSARRATKGFQRAVGGDRISIHALREEGDVHAGNQRVRHTISIHALREEGDTLFIKVCDKIN